MKLSVPFNGDVQLIYQLQGYPQVSEIYGKLTADCIGGGKHSFQTPSITRAKVATAVKTAHTYDLEFNYLLNSSCLDNREWTSGGQKNIERLLDWLSGIKADAVTVAVPYLLELIKKRYPLLKVYVSNLAYVNTLRRAKFWEGLGADRITLFNIELNRDFSSLRHIRHGIKCQLKLILNANCIHACPFYMYHANVASHASQADHSLKGFVIDYCRMRCRYQQLIEPVNFIRSSWIRPEDVGQYEEIGIDYFKIIDRGMKTNTIVSIVDAYTKRSYNGNLLDLFPDPTKSIIVEKASLLIKLKYFFRPLTANLFILKGFRNLCTSPVYVDNQRLSGFIEGLKKKECKSNDCQACRYCYEWADKVIAIDPEVSKKAQEHYRFCLENIISGKLFRY